MNLNHTISLLEASTFRANRVQDLHQEKRNLHCKYAQNQKNFNLPKQRGLSVKKELGIVTIHHHCHHSITFHLPSGFHTSHLALLLLPLPGLNCTFLCAANVAIQRHCKACSYPALVQDPLIGAPLLQCLLSPPKPHSAALRSASPSFMRMQKCCAMLASGQGAKSIPGITTGMNLVQVLMIKVNTMFE